MSFGTWEELSTDKTMFVPAIPRILPQGVMVVKLVTLWISIPMAQVQLPPELTG